MDNSWRDVVVPAWQEALFNHMGLPDIHYTLLKELVGW
jgi:hypothetical protein